MTTKQQKLFARLSRLAVQSKPVLQTGRVFHAAFGIYQGHIVAVGYNNYLKTSPSTQGYTKDAGMYFPKTHAESDLVRKLRKCGVSPAKVTILVVNVRGGNKLGLSKPCSNCAHRLGLEQYKDVWFSTRTGAFEKL